LHADSEEEDPAVSVDVLDNVRVPAVLNNRVRTIEDDWVDPRRGIVVGAQRRLGAVDAGLVVDMGPALCYQQVIIPISLEDVRTFGAQAGVERLPQNLGRGEGPSRFKVNLTASDHSTVVWGQTVYVQVATGAEVDLVILIKEELYASVQELRSV
jgi:hypothetical protein